MQNNTSPDTNGLKAILKHNETTQPNDDLLNALKTAVPQFFDKDGNFKTDKFEDELKINNISEARDGYKLGFVGKNYARLQVGLKSETMIVPDKKYNDQPENANSGNVFITGDNLEALRHLVNAYENQIKLIYIDPPYNTGKEFIYNDKFEFNDEKLKSILGYSDEEIIRLKSIQGKSSHSAWLTFMYPRLKIAQRLLKDNGVILVSIDDNEQTNLKLLMDDVFGESNFVGQFTINSTPNARDYGHIGKMHDYALFYTKQSMIAETFLIPEEDKYFKYVDNKGGYNIHPLYNSNIAFTKNNRPNLYYPFYIYPEKKQNEFFEIGLKKEDKTIEVFPPKSQKEGIQFVWRWGKKKSMEYINQEIIGYRTEDGEYRIVQKMRNTEKIIRSLLLKKEFINRKGTAELEELFNVKFFNFPKPVSLIKLFVQATTKNNDLILDFFAGSSTTAHAVMQLNSEDGGNRKFIMVQLDEKTNPDSEARKAGYNTIDEIARKRIDLAGQKILADYESDLVKQTNGWDKDIGFKHYRLVTPDVKTLEKIIEFNPEETNLIADDMIKPFEYKKTETGGLDTILATWLIDDGYRFDTPVEEITFGNYKAHYVREATTLYLINMGWETKALKEMLNQIGTNKLLVNTIVVYPYSFEFEAMRELKTNIKTNLDKSPNLIERY
jgi:adenine specific DNA methylase Mod